MSVQSGQGKSRTTERTSEDYAIEFGIYLATAAERFMAEQNRAFEAGETPDSDHWSALSSAIYEFRKRARVARIAAAGEKL